MNSEEVRSKKSPNLTAWGFFGGSEENRTPVQKLIHTGISERSRIFTFPYKAVKRPTALLSSPYCVTVGGTPRRSRSPLNRRLALAVVI